MFLWAVFIGKVRYSDTEGLLASAGGNPQAGMGGAGFLFDAAKLQGGPTGFSPEMQWRRQD